MTKFPWSLWCWTLASEDLFLLSKEELVWFKLITNYAA